VPTRDRNAPGGGDKVNKTSLAQIINATGLDLVSVSGSGPLSVGMATTFPQASPVGYPGIDLCASENKVKENIVVSSEHKRYWAKPGECFELKALGVLG
jgi:hypothetical protein